MDRFSSCLWCRPLALQRTDSLSPVICKSEQLRVTWLQRDAQRKEKTLTSSSCWCGRGQRAAAYLRDAGRTQQSQANGDPSISRDSSRFKVTLVSLRGLCWVPGRMQSTSGGTLGAEGFYRILRFSEPKPAHKTDTCDGNDGKKSSKGEKPGRKCTCWVIVRKSRAKQRNRCLSFFLLSLLFWHHFDPDLEIFKNSPNLAEKSGLVKDLIL